MAQGSSTVLVLQGECGRLAGRPAVNLYLKLVLVLVAQLLVMTHLCGLSPTVLEAVMPEACPRTAISEGSSVMPGLRVRTVYQRALMMELFVPCPGRVR